MRLFKSRFDWSRDVKNFVVLWLRFPRTRKAYFHVLLWVWKVDLILLKDLPRWLCLLDVLFEIRQICPLDEFRSLSNQVYFSLQFDSCVVFIRYFVNRDDRTFAFTLNYMCLTISLEKSFPHRAQHHRGLLLILRRSRVLVDVLLIFDSRAFQFRNRATYLCFLFLHLLE